MVNSESLGLTRLVTEPTRVTANLNTLIDHIYINEEEHVSNIHVSHLQIIVVIMLHVSFVIENYALF